MTNRMTKKMLLTVLCFAALFTAAAQKVSLSGRQLEVNDIPYTIKGVCYHPVSKGESGRDFEHLDRDLELMQEAGINTIRVYEPIGDKKVLDKLFESGIRVIIGFGYNQNGQFDILSETCLDYVKTYKDHPAILYWELGNEYNYHPEWFGGDINTWYKALNTMAAKIHGIDQDHPVATAHGELPTPEILSMCPAVDIWGMNIYRWDNPQELFSQWEAISEKPMYISEAGADSYMTVAAHGYEEGKNEKAQADALQKILTQVLEHEEVSLGVTVFSFVDEWWKAGNPDQQDKGGWAPGSSGVPYDRTPNEEYWGIINIDRQQKEAYYILKTLFTNTKTN